MAAPHPSTVVSRTLTWYDEHGRDLPWRRADATPWHIMISEFMLQQTPVARVLEPYQQWTTRWPTPADLAGEPAGEAVRAWGRLGYPRRALRLHQTAIALVRDHSGQVPEDLVALRALPGVGEYTAAAIASFAFGQRHPVMDTNVRRVLARAGAGRAECGPAPTAAERALAARFLPRSRRRAARWAVACMELGALICIARAPRCDSCPIRHQCRWQQAGRPPTGGPPRRAQSYDGTDRQCRGALLAALREAEDGLSHAQLVDAWPNADQRDRCLASLISDGLTEVREISGYRLPG